MKNIKVGVLGANGQIAATLLRRIAEESDAQPVAVCRNQVGATVIKDVDCDVRIGSVADPDTANKLLSDCDVVVNCIWPNLPSNGTELENEAIINNLGRVPRLARIIHLSSVAVYGCIYDGSTFLRPRPDTVYGREKLSLEKYVAGVFGGLSRDYFIIRLGHVFGPNQWLSKSVVHLTGSGNFKLPFDGTCPSNAIHVDEVADALTWLASAGISSGVYNLAATPQKTWREIFDWHAGICGLPRVLSMSDEGSRALRDSYIKNSQRSGGTKCLIESLSWIRSLPIQRLIGSGEMRNLCSRVLRLMPDSIRRPVKLGNALRHVNQEIVALERPTITPEPWLYSDAMPGPYIKAPHSASYTGRLTESENQILDWYRAKSAPQWSFMDSTNEWKGSDRSEARVGV